MSDRIKVMTTIDPVHHLAIRIKATKDGKQMGEVIEDMVRLQLPTELIQAKDAMKDRKVKK